jgi:hypothetical protein
MARDAEAMGLADDEPEGRRDVQASALLQKWSRLHDCRTVLSLSAFVLAAAALSAQGSVRCGAS